MFRLFRSSSDCRLIDRGLVRCPLREADVEIDICAGCDALREIDQQAKLPYVRCRPRFGLKYPHAYTAF